MIFLFPRLDMIVPWRVSPFMNWEQWSSWSSIDDSWPSIFVHYSRLFSEVFISKLAIGNWKSQRKWHRKSCLKLPLYLVYLFMLVFVCVIYITENFPMSVETQPGPGCLRVAQVHGRDLGMDPHGEFHVINWFNPIESMGRVWYIYLHEFGCF